MRTLRGNQALCEALAQEMERDERVFVFGEDVARHGGVFRVTESLLGRFGPTRVIDTPISESGMVGLAVGAALMGMRPVVEIQFTDLVTIAMDQIVNSAAKARYVHDGAMHAPLVVRTVNLGKGTVYSSQALEAWFVHVPGLKVVTPSNPYDAKGLLISAIRDPDPVIFIEHKSLYGMRGPVPEEPYAIPFGRAEVRRQGADVTVVAWSAAVALVEEAAEELVGEGVEVEVINLRTLIPFDKDSVLDSVKKTGRLVLVEEAVRRGGVGAEIAAAVVESEAFGYLQAPIVRVANPGVPVPHSAALHRFAFPHKDDVIAAVRRVVAYA
ncbi:MAG: alpha-ketoacid dehydrogenase subunit beta [Chloroflexi bacterium]|nr:alpha-ketoacid dehydrogenase subunit beta [Chloroflexota bacterium]